MPDFDACAVLNLVFPFHICLLQFLLTHFWSSLEQPWSSLEQRGAALDQPGAAWSSLGVALGQSLGGLGQTASQSVPVNPPQSHFQAFPKNRPLNFLGLF